MTKRYGVAFILICAISLSSNSAVAATIKAGAICPKVGVKSGQFICAKVSGKLKWQIVKRAQKISFVQPMNVTVADGARSIEASSSSKLSVSLQSSTKEICDVSGASITFPGAAGVCILSLNQPGNAYFLAASAAKVEFVVYGINIIQFDLPGALLLSQGTYPLEGMSTSGIPITFVSNTPQTCSVADSLLTVLKIGNCSVSATQPGSDFYPPALEVVRSLEISADRVSADLQDTIQGFQLKAIYVVPSDGVDHFYDTNGVITGILQGGTNYLREEVGLTLPIDSTSTGYDITFLKSTKDSNYFLTNSGSYAALLQESGFLDAPSPNRKEFIFFVDTNTVVGPNYCGEASIRGISAVVAIGVEVCGNRTTFFENYASQTWIHEVFHNFGVSHVPISCDLMFSGQSSDGAPCPANQRDTIDINHALYLGSKAYGEDLLTLRVWDTYTADQELKADCWLSTTNGITRSDKVNFALCPTGTQAIGPLSFCWSQLNSASLEENINGVWVSLGSGNHSNSPWGTRVSWSCNDPNYSAPWKFITVLTPGLRHYRWIVNGNIDEEFNVIWQS